jgi:hypothetical protein
MMVLNKLKNIANIAGQKYDLCSTAAYSLAETPQPPPPAFGLPYEGAIGQPR